MTSELEHQRAGTMKRAKIAVIQVAVVAPTVCTGFAGVFTGSDLLLNIGLGGVVVGLPAMAATIGLEIRGRRIVRRLNNEQVDLSRAVRHEAYREQDVLDLVREIDRTPVERLMAKTVETIRSIDMPLGPAPKDRDFGTEAGMTY